MKCICEISLIDIMEYNKHLDEFIFDSENKKLCMIRTLERIVKKIISNFKD